jgi:hypothetical protein
MPFARSRRPPGRVSRIASGLPGDVRRALKIVGGQPVVGIEMKYHPGRGRLERIRINLAHDRDDRANITGTLNLVSARIQEKSYPVSGGSFGQMGVQHRVNFAQFRVKGVGMAIASSRQS